MIYLILAFFVIAMMLLILSALEMWRANHIGLTERGAWKYCAWCAMYYNDAKRIKQFKMPADFRLIQGRRSDSICGDCSEKQVSKMEKCAK